MSVASVTNMRYDPDIENRHGNKQGDLLRCASISWFQVVSGSVSQSVSDAFSVIKYSVDTNVRGNTSNARNASDAGYARNASNTIMQLMHVMQVMDNDNQWWSIIIHDNQLYLTKLDGEVSLHSGSIQAQWMARHAMSKNWPFGKENRFFAKKTPQKRLFLCARIWFTWLWKAWAGNGWHQVRWTTPPTWTLKGIC